MRLDVLATGSAGNCYALHAGGETLLLDAGIPIRQIVAGVADWDRVVGCLVTHEHMDHAKAVPDLLRRGVPVCMSRGTQDGLPMMGVETSALQSTVERSQSGRPLRMGHFTILPFAAQHDALEPQGFLLRHDLSGEKLL